MRVLNGFEVEQNPTKSCYKISGKDVPSDFEIRIRFENGKYKAEANYSKKPSSTAQVHGNLGVYHLTAKKKHLKIS